MDQRLGGLRRMLVTGGVVNERNGITSRRTMEKAKAHPKLKLLLIMMTSYRDSYSIAYMRGMLTP